MVDNTSPTNQFHEYQPIDATPHVDMPSNKLDSWRNRARGMAQKNPGAVLGGLAALVIGAGLMRKRGLR